MSDEETTTGSLENAKNLRTLRREFLAERIGWLIIAAILTLGVLGFFGPGLFSYREVTSPAGELSASYHAVERYEAPAKLTIRFADPERRDRLVRIALSRQFADQIVAETIVPEPESTTMLSERIVYAFRVSDLREEGKIVWRYKNDAWGWRQFQVSLVDGPVINITQFVCP